MNLELSIYKSIISYFKYLSDGDRIKYIKYLEININLLDEMNEPYIYELYIQNIKDLKYFNNSLLNNISDFNTMKLLYRNKKYNIVFSLLLLRITHSYVQLFQTSLFNSNNHGNISNIYEILSFIHTFASKNIPVEIYKNILIETIEFCDHNNLYLQSLIYKEILYDDSLFKFSTKAYLKNKNNYINQFSLYKDYIETKVSSYDLSINYRYNIYLNESYFDNIKDIYVYIKDIGKDSKRFKIDYYLYFLLFEYYYFYYDEIKIKDLIQRFKEFLHLNTYVLDKYLLHNGFINIALQNYLINNYKVALCEIHEFLGHDNLNNKVKFTFYFILLSIYINTEDISNYLEIMYMINKHENNSYYKTHLPTINFYHANYYFLSGNYKESIQHLQYCSSLLNDKAGYGMGIRILEIMNYMTWEHFDQVELALVNLKNQITALKKNGKLKPRYQYIYKILLKLHTSGYNYKNTFRIFASKLKLMASREDTMFRWDVRSPEMIRLDTWFFKQAGFLPPWSLD